ncbi:hypothetical protein L0B53_13045 [Vibrio sp. SS-MA-C1-2]|uniref:hypothetical protein n=1 Tax=Vibrio sp. SS-MA-C1-2 TaxID=2908646 RepID=UPI001F308029|nr:hypothetical protein [Vibrio sp. SS-MA-C1-2]UJF17948.1 hypothetical protein L0B53_13045 [Vibrio sp. SS-MA-C1-2]
MSNKFVLAAIAVASLVTATASQAAVVVNNHHNNAVVVRPARTVVVKPAPVVVRPAPVVVAPRPVVVAPRPVVIVPTAAWGRRVVWIDGRRIVLRVSPVGVPYIHRGGSWVVYR